MSLYEVTVPRRFVNVYDHNNVVMINPIIGADNSVRAVMVTEGNSESTLNGLNEIEQAVTSLKRNGYQEFLLG